MTRKQEKPRHSLHHSGCRGFLSFLYMLFGFCQCKTSSSACLGSACLLQTRVSWDTIHLWVGQAEHLACRKRQPGAFAGAARTHSRRRAGRPQEGPCRGRVGPVCWFRGRGGEMIPVEGIWTVLGRVWGGGCPDHPNSEEERLRGPRFGPFGGVRFSY